MGKNLKGRECGKGICQRKDGKYSARYSTRDGKRCEKHFDTLQEARNLSAKRWNTGIKRTYGGQGRQKLPIAAVLFH